MSILRIPHEKILKKASSPVKLSRTSVAAAALTTLTLLAVPSAFTAQSSAEPVPAAPEISDGAVAAADMDATPSDAAILLNLPADPAATPASDTEGTVVVNMPEKPVGGPGEVKPLASAPRSYTGGSQSWFRSAPRYGFTPLSVYSQSMERDIPIAFRPAATPGAPTVYLLNGAGGSEQDTDWIAQAGQTVWEVFKDENVNVVIPMEGAFSYYVNWLSVPETNSYYHGKQMWSTFLGEELPQSIEPYAQAGDKRAVVGFSMSATSSLLLAQHYQGRYAAVGSFSGCAATSTPLPWAYTHLTVNRGSGALTPEHLWGSMGSEYNRYNDALVNAERLRGTELYVSTATGLAAETDMAGFLEAKGFDTAAASQNAMTLQVEGGAIEAAMNACTHDLKAKLDRAGIGAHWELRPTGTHSWPAWQDDLKKSWEITLKPALGLASP